MIPFTADSGEIGNDALSVRDGPGRSTKETETAMQDHSLDTTTDLTPASPQLLSDADVDQVSGGFFFIAAVAIALVAAEACVSDKNAH